MYAAAYVWAKIVGYMEQRLTDIAVNAWFDDTEVIEYNDRNLVLYSPNDYRQEVIRDRFFPYIRDALKELFDSSAEPLLWGDAELGQHRRQTKNVTRALCNPQYSFENFVTGESNQIAVKIAQAAAANPGQNLYNPLFLYGPPGVGKTHLLSAIANHICHTKPDKQVVYIRGDQFTNELITSLRDNKMPEFKQKYRREPDVLLVDDIQFIAGKDSTQEEFFHTFNELYENGKQIVMSADRKPADMATLEDRLRGRFGVGIMVGISPPDPDTRMSIIRAKAADIGLPLDEASIRYLTDRLTDNVRQIEGALKKLRAFHALGAVELSMENIPKILADICTEEGPRPVTVQAVIRNVCRYFGVEEADLRGPQKCKNIAQPRQIAMYLMRTLMSMSFSDIGKTFGGRDHGTVHHAVKKVESLLRQQDATLAGILEDITANIKNSAG